MTDGACLHCRQKTLGLYIGWQKTRHSLGVGTVQDIMKRMPIFCCPFSDCRFFSWSFSFFVILNSNFSVALLFLPSQFSLRVYPLHNFPLPIFFRCRFRFLYFIHKLCVAVYSYPLIFCCRFFRLPNFPVAVSSVAVFFQLRYLPLPFFPWI